MSNRTNEYIVLSVLYAMIVLKQSGNSKTSDGAFWFSGIQISQVLGMSYKQTMRDLDRLVSEHFITKDIYEYRTDVMATVYAITDVGSEMLINYAYSLEKVEAEMITRKRNKVTLETILK